MDNNEILQKRWKEVDELLSTFYSKNKKINRNMYNKIQHILNGIKYSYDDLYKYASVNEIKKFRRQIEELKDKYELTGYTGYLINNLYKRTKLKNSEILIGLLTKAYYEQMQEQNIEEKVLFDEIVKVSYRQGQMEYIEILQKEPRRRLKHKPRLLTIPEAFLLQLIGFNGFKWQDYKEGNLNYYVKQLFQVIAINLQQGKELNDDNITKTLEKQERTYFAKKDVEQTKAYTDVYYGMVDNQVVYLANICALEGMKRQGCKKVRFIATLDEKTTTMCKTLDNQVFKIDGWNTYSRYSAEDKKNIIYRTKGLEAGANLPPINNHIHHCRSTIYPER